MLSSLLSKSRHLLSSTTATRCCTSRFIASATTPLQMALDDFRDLVPREKRAREPVGRSWAAKELRRKSFEDLHKLWHVLYKEKNMLFTELQLSRRSQLKFPQAERIQKVKKSMGAIRHVLGERKREKLAQFALRGVEQEEAEKGTEED